MGIALVVNFIDLRPVFRKAIERNITVYDADAESGELTRRLISLMKVVNRRNGKNSIDKIYTPINCGVSDVFGVKIEYLVSSKTLTEDYSESLGMGKELFCLGVGDGEPILGMF
jgi:hypothetical protein